VAGPRRATLGGDDSMQAAAAALAGARRIAILGGAGAGKSTLSLALGRRLGLPVVHLDRLRYGPGWTEVEPALFRRRVAEAAAAEAWVVDGTYGEARELMLPRAEVVLWLDQPALRRLRRAWLKVVRYRGRPRADRPDGCEEAFGWSYVRTIFAFGAWSPATADWLREGAPAALVVRVRGDGDARRLRQALGT
jgi:adenylate kinase family enzyme